MGKESEKFISSFDSSYMLFSPFKLALFLCLKQCVLSSLRVHRIHRQEFIKQRRETKLQRVAEMNLGGIKSEKHLIRNNTELSRQARGMINNQIMFSVLSEFHGAKHKSNKLNEHYALG